MPGLSSAIPLILAQAAPAAEGEPGGGLMVTFAYVVPIMFLFYLLILRPQQQQQKKQQELVNALKKNDRVLTSSGIFGTVISVDSDANRVVLRVDDDRGVKMEFTKTSVVQVVEPTEKAAKAG
jgi:preprotein translocase subunit YajC